MYSVFGSDATTSLSLMMTVSKPFGAISRAISLTSAEGDTTRILGFIVLVLVFGVRPPEAAGYSPLGKAGATQPWGGRIRHARGSRPRTGGLAPTAFPEKWTPFSGKKRR